MRQSWSRKEMNWIDVGFAVVGVAVSMYIVVFYHDLVLRAGMNNETDYIIALIGTLLVIEGARRVRFVRTHAAGHYRSPRPWPA